MRQPENDPMTSSDVPAQEDPPAKADQSEFDKTPIFTATHASRYQRQGMIRDVEAVTQRMLLCYVSGNSTSIHPDDTLGFIEMLHNVPSGAKIDLLLHTLGGDLDAAEKLINLLRAKVGQDTEQEEKLRVIVPDFAKSAGTLIALGASSIVMSDSSELGTIDPQIVLADRHGNRIQHSVLGYIDAYKKSEEAMQGAPDNKAKIIMFEKFEPMILHMCELSSDRARASAEDLLKRQGANWTKIISDLMDIKKFPSHGQMIGSEEAKEIGLNITYMDPQNPVWKQYWSIYCYLRLAIRDDQKIFVSSMMSYIVPSN